MAVTRTQEDVSNAGATDRTERSPPAKTFGTRIRQLRTAKGFTQWDLAEQVVKGLRGAEKGRFGVSYLSKIENDRFPPPADAAIIELAGVLEADLDELLALARRPPLGLREKLAKNPGARAFFRFAIDRLNQEEWQELLSRLTERKKSCNEHGVDTQLDGS